jgi:hypothetical protein
MNFFGRTGGDSRLQCDRTPISARRRRLKYSCAQLVQAPSLTRCVIDALKQSRSIRHARTIAGGDAGDLLVNPLHHCGITDGSVEDYHVRNKDRAQVTATEAGAALLRS